MASTTRYERLTSAEDVKTLTNQAFPSSGSSTPSSKTDGKIDTVIAVQELKVTEKKPLKNTPLLFLDPKPAGEEEDEEEEDLSYAKIAKKFQPIGFEQVSHIGRAYTLIIVAGAAMYRSPAFVAELAGAGTDVAKKIAPFLSMTWGRWLAVRTVAYGVLPGLYVGSLFINTPYPVANEMARAVGGTLLYPAGGVARYDLNSIFHLKVAAKKVRASTEGSENPLLKKIHRITGYKNGFEVVDAIAKMAASMVVFEFATDVQPRALSTIIFKVSVRRFIDLTADQLRLQQDTVKGKLLFAAYAATIVGCGVGGVANMIEGSHRSLDIVLLLPAVDTTFRWIKSRWKDRIEAETKDKKEIVLHWPTFLKATAIFGVAGFSAGLVSKGMTCLIPPDVNSSLGTSSVAASMTAAFYQDGVSLLKVWSKKLGYEGMIGIAAIYMTLMFSIYFSTEFAGAQLEMWGVDMLEWMLAACIGAGGLAGGTYLYQERKQEVPPKKPKAPKIEKTEAAPTIEDGQAKLSKDEQKALKKAAKKAAKAQALESGKTEPSKQEGVSKADKKAAKKAAKAAEKARLAAGTSTDELPPSTIVDITDEVEPKQAN